HALVQDWLWGTEIECNFEYNPIYGVVARLMKELGCGWGDRRLVHKPPVERAMDTARQQGRWEDVTALWDTAPIYGAECVLHTKDCGDIKRTVWLPNFKTPMFSGIGLAEELAALVALDTLRQLR